jgi:hypothetical protein
MKWRVIEPPLFDYLKWHRWFAWYPVQGGHHKYWLCTVMRKADLPEQDITSRAAINNVIRVCGCKCWIYKELIYYP